MWLFDYYWLIMPGNLIIAYSLECFSVAITHWKPLQGEYFENGTYSDMEVMRDGELLSVFELKYCFRSFTVMKTLNTMIKK